jgi:hypothetical protein
MADEETYKAFQKVAEEIGSLKQELKEIKGEGKLPWYLAKTPDEMEQELIRQGRLEIPEEGLQDDGAGAFRFAIRTNERGQQIAGLESKYFANAPISFMEVCENLTVVSTAWNFTPLGYISSFKGGWNSEIAKAEKEAEKDIKYVKSNVNAVTEMKSIVDYFGNYKQLMETLNEGEKYKWRFNNATNKYELNSIQQPDPNEPISFYFACCTSNGPKIRKRNIPRKDSTRIVPLSCD